MLRFYPEDWRAFVEIPLLIAAVPLSAWAHVYFASEWLDLAMLVGFALASWRVGRPVN